MAAPSTAITRLDLSISYGEFSLMANQGKFIGLMLLPPLGVAQEASDFAKISVESLLSKVEDTRRAPKNTYSRDTWDWTTDSYAVQEHGVEEVVDDATVERYGDVVRAEQVSTNRAVNRVLQRLEYDIAAAAELAGNNASTSDVDATAGGTSGEKWTVTASADPVGDVDYAHDLLEAQCGEKGNTLRLTRTNFRAMIRTARLENLLKYDASELLLSMSQGINQSMISDVMTGLKALLQVDRILVGRGFKNTADKGQTASLTRFWDDTKANLCVVRDDGMEGDLENPMPQWGRTIFSTKNSEPMPGMADAGLGSLIIEEYRDEPVRGSVVRPRNKRQVKILHTACGHLFTNVT